MEFLFWLITAHFIADFALQTSFMSEYKAKLALVLIAHCIIWTGVMLIPVKLFGFGVTWQVVAFLFVAHWLIDKGKIAAFSFVELFCVNTEIDKTKIALFYFDQVLHFIQIFVLWGIYSW